jgi:hypothetical protein
LPKCLSLHKYLCATTESDHIACNYSKHWGRQAVASKHKEINMYHKAKKSKSKKTKTKKARKSKGKYKMKGYGK